MQYIYLSLLAEDQVYVCIYLVIFFSFFVYSLQSVKRQAICNVYTLFYDERKGFEER
jgi:hypothetical protein